GRDRVSLRADRPPVRGQVGQRLSFWYARTVRGSITAVMRTGQATASAVAWSVTNPPVPCEGLPNSSRVAVIVADSGFHSATVPSQPGISEGSMKALDSIVTG